MNLDRQLYQVYRKKSASHRTIFHPFGQEREGWVLCLLDITSAAVTVYELFSAKESEPTQLIKGEVFRYSKVKSQLKLAKQWRTENLVVFKRSSTHFAFQCDKRLDYCFDFRHPDSAVCKALLHSISYFKGVVFQRETSVEHLSDIRCNVEIIHHDDDITNPCSARSCASRNCMKATLQMSTSHVTLTRLRHLCEWCDDQLEEEVLSRPFKNIAWFRLEDQDTRIRLHFAAGYDESGFMSAEAEICLQVDDQANMESIIAMMPGSTVESVWLGGLYYTEYEEILGCTVREFMRVRGFGSSRSTSEVERIVPNPRIDSLKHAEEYKRGVAAR